MKEEFGKELDIDKVGENSIKFFDDADILDYFMSSDQVKFWENRGHPFKRLTAEECQNHIPILGKWYQYLIWFRLKQNCSIITICVLTF